MHKEHVFHDIRPVISIMITPLIRPVWRNKRGIASIVPPKVPLTNANIVANEPLVLIESLIKNWIEMKIIFWINI